MPPHHSNKRRRSHDSRDRRVSPYSLLSKLPISDSLEERHLQSAGLTRVQQRKLDRKNKRKRKSNSCRNRRRETELATAVDHAVSASGSSGSKEQPRKKPRLNRVAETHHIEDSAGATTPARPKPPIAKPEIVPAHDHPDSREIRRLERLLGIRKHRKPSKAADLYHGVFDDADTDLLDLVKACDQTLNRGSSAAERDPEDGESGEEPDAGVQDSEIEEAHEDSSSGALQSDEDDNSSGSKHSRAETPDVSSDESEQHVPYVARWKRGGANREGAGKDPSSGFSMKALQGLLNRVSASNTADIAKSISSLYPKDSSTAERGEIAGSYVDAVLDAINQGNTMGTTNPYLRAHVDVVFNLGTTVDITLLAKFIAATVKRLRASLESDGGSTIREAALRMSHILGYVVTLCAAYEIGVVSSPFMYELLKWVAEPSCKTRLDAELKLLQEVGPLLRKKDPVIFADVVKFVHRHAKQEAATEDAKSSSNDSSFKLSMLADTVENIRNNRTKAMKHISQDMDQPRAHLPFQASLLQLLDDNFTSRKWWEDGRGEELTAEGTRGEQQRKGAGSDRDGTRISKLATALRLHTDSRRGLLAAVLNSTSCQDAIQRIDRLGTFASKQKLKDLTYIITHCCGAEQPYNKFYSFLGNRICQKSREARFAMEFTIQDAFKGTESYDSGGQLSRKAKNVARYLGDLWASEGLPLSMMRRMPDLEDISVGEQNFYAFSFERMVSQRIKANVDPSAPFARLTRETFSGGSLFCSSLAVFLRRHVCPKVSGRVGAVISKAVNDLERKPKSAT